MTHTASKLGLALVLCAIAPAWPAPAWADSVSGAMQAGYGRLSFSTPAQVSASTTGGVLTVSFSDKTNIDPAAVAAAMPRYIANGHADPDGRTLRFALNQTVRLHVSQQGSHAVVDLAGGDFTGTMPDLPPPVKPVAKPIDPNSLPEVKLRTGAYSHFTRLVFDWTKDVPYTVFPGAGKMTIRFQTLARPDLSAVARFAPPWVKNAAWHIEGNAILVEFETDSDSGYHDFKDGNHIVLDILAPKTDGAAYVPPGSAKPGITAMKPGATTAQAQAILEASVQLAPKKPPAPTKTPDARTPPLKPSDAAAPPATQAADAKATATPAAAPADAASAQADGKRSGNSMVLTFKGAAVRSGAIFVRGLTAWIVLENAPAFDTARLKATLGDFAANTEAASSNGLSILRLTLKAPANIAATAAGPDLQVAIGAQVASTALPIGFGRNQSDSRRASLTTLVPGADHAFRVPDPAAGDTLIIVPGVPGTAMPALRAFADFAALPTASGLVIMPYSDDLAVGADQSHVTITRPGGLALTPPQSPATLSPSALARTGDGPSYLDFRNWSRPSGSFLATERQLTAAVARQPGISAGGARLDLAHFYLANGFAAEALGMIALIQKQDPGLAGDAHLAVMRGAAEYMMGRYRDAHTDLSSPMFDTARHAALWRGLTEAGLEDWKTAHEHLGQAQEVLGRYPDAWQAAAHLADAEASLGMGRLDLADSALLQMPRNLAPKQALQQELLQARLAAAESRYTEAADHFAAIEKSGNEALAAQAIYYHTIAGMTAGAVPVPQAIETLERLRFRWRGDSLEMKTLRKLASLYFGRNQWRDGLRTLRVAVQNFPVQDAARQAQDDMRAAFVNLFLKGGADKMKPVDSLALFYDNMDLTPIGPDGDEMIRRISDRLVAVDLLGPAANLLAYQVDKRLDGIAKAQVSGRLAAIYLMDHKPDLAVKAIRDSTITGLPDPDLHARMLLEARAFAALKQWDNALDLIAADQAPDTRRLRADIYWESGNWAVAGQKAEEMLDTRWSDAAPLSAADRAEVLRAATAYSLANDQASLDRMSVHFTPKMKGSPDATLFAVLSAPIAAHGLAFRDAAAQIASVDTLESFMKDFSKRYADNAAPRS